jgi:trans-2,3-dihydro-3-hydroxyanthranilate isomerase
MTKISYRLLNVFAETAFGGNPLAVIEDGSALTDREMQLVARQFNLSETTFILPSNIAAAQIRIFTTSYEMDFAGHPTLGSAQVIRELFQLEDAFKIEMKAGLIPVSAIQNHWTLFANTPRYRPMLASRSELTAMLNLPHAAIAGNPLWVDCGTEQLMIPLASPEFVHACRPDLRLMAKYSKNLSGQAKTYVFAKTPDGFESRYFSMAEENSISEDPGTGSACANLGAWWIATEADKPLTAKINQGTFIQRPNVLSLHVANGEIQVGGRVIEVGRGELHW